MPYRPSLGSAAGGTPDAAHELAAAERWFHTLVQHGSDLIIVLDRQARLVYANPAARALLGFATAACLGRDLWDMIHAEDRDRAAAAFQGDLAASGVHEPSVYRVRTAAGGWRFVEVVATNRLDDPAIEGIVLNGRDITDRMNLARAMRTLGSCNQVLVRSRDEQSLLLDTCRTIVEAGGYLLAWVGYVERDPARVVSPVAAAGETGYLEDIRVSWGDDETGRGPAGTAIRTGKAQVLRDTHRSRSFARWRAAADRYGLRTACAVPLGVGGDAIGALMIYAGEPGAFDEAALGILQELADDLSYGIGRLRDAAALEASEERFRTLAAGAPIGILEVGPGGAVTYANSRIGEIAGRDCPSLMGRGWLDVVHPEDVPRMVSIADGPARRDGPLVARFRIRRPDGELRHVQLSATRRHGADPSHVVTIADVTEEVTAQEALAHHAFYDTRTGLANRALFLDRLDQELAGQRRDRSRCAVIFLSLDRLEVVNGSLGHESGDAVLKEVADRFVGSVRGGETVARFGDDQFAFIVRDIGRPDQAVVAAERLLGLLRSPVRHAGHELVVTGSVGIAIPEPGAPVMSVVREADTAMYQAKLGGGNRYELFDEELHRRAIARFAMEGELREALAQGEFELYYQPSIDLATGRPRGAEALIRWNHPLRGLVPPVDFVPVAEETGLIEPIGSWVIEEAVTQLARWDAQPAGPRLAVLAVNISARQLEDSVCEVVRRSLDGCGVEASRVAVELTESAVMSDGAAARASLEGFRRLGVGLAIDDFGTGYSSLARLHALPVTTVKVDRSFVARLGSTDDATPVVQAIIDMAHAMGLRVVAEGVEDEAQARLLSDLGCDEAQGYLWARPVPAGDFARWWASAV